MRSLIFARLPRNFSESFHLRGWNGTTSRISIIGVPRLLTRRHSSYSRWRTSLRDGPSSLLPVAVGVTALSGALLVEDSRSRVVLAAGAPGQGGDDRPAPRAAGVDAGSGGDETVSKVEPYSVDELRDLLMAHVADMPPKSGGTRTTPGVRVEKHGTRGAQVVFRFGDDTNVVRMVVDLSALLAHDAVTFQGLTVSTDSVFQVHLVLTYSDFQGKDSAVHLTFDSWSVRPFLSVTSGELELVKSGDEFSPGEIDAIKRALDIGYGRPVPPLSFNLHKSPLWSLFGTASAPREPLSDAAAEQPAASSPRPARPSGSPSAESEQRGARERRARAAEQKLNSMGLEVFRTAADGTSGHERALTWSDLAGYDDVKQEVQDSVVLSLERPDVYEDIARKTRATYEPNLPRAILFEGPPGTGKTTCARILAAQCQTPMVYVPLESVLSKWYGESEQRLAEVFQLAGDLADKVLVFVDEIDSLAPSRDMASGGDMFEASRRLLSVLLRHVDGFESAGRGRRMILIGATNRPQDVDRALLSRFDLAVRFDVPSAVTRAAIFAQYAKHLSAANLELLAGPDSDGFVGRDIRDVCLNTERKWASKRIRGDVAADQASELPPATEYLDAIRNKRLQKLYATLRSTPPSMFTQPPSAPAQHKVEA